MNNIAYEMLKKETEYKTYIDTHRSNVKKAWEELQVIWDCKSFVSDHDKYFTITKNILNHDLSKYDEEEFSYYRAYFYPINSDEKIHAKAGFDKAWKHHYENNRHHWDFYVHNGKCDNMPIEYIVEMLCDWQAMGYTFDNNAAQFYEKEKQNIRLSTTTKMIVEDLLSYIK